MKMNSASYRALLLLSAFFVLSLSFSSCSKINPEEPVSGNFEEAPEVPVSYLSTPVLYKIAELEAMINQKLDGTVYEDNSFTNNNNDNIKLKIRKVRPITIDMVGKDLYYRVPLGIDFEGKASKKILGMKLSKKQAVDFSCILRFRSSVSLSKDWRIVTETESLGIEWIEKPNIKVGPLKINLARLVEKELGKRKSELEKKIDEAAYKHLNLKKEIEKVWTSLQKPILLDKKTGKLWLAAYPQSLEASDVMGVKGYFRVFVRINTKLETVLSEKPEVKANTSLPDMTYNPNLSNDFKLFATGKVYYEAVNELLKEKLKGKVINLDGGFKVKLKNAEVRGSGKDLILKLKVGGSAKGTVYFRGTPAYDKENNRLFMENFRFDVETEEILVSAADWLLNETLREEIQSKLELPLGEHLEKLPELILKGINGSNISDKVQLDLINFDLQPQNIRVAEEALEVLVAAEGNVGLQLKNLDKKLPAKKKP